MVPAGLRDQRVELLERRDRGVDQREELSANWAAAGRRASTRRPAGSARPCRLQAVERMGSSGQRRWQERERLLKGLALARDPVAVLVFEISCVSARCAKRAPALAPLNQQPVERRRRMARPSDVQVLSNPGAYSSALLASAPLFCNDAASPRSVPTARSASAGRACRTPRRGSPSRSCGSARSRRRSGSPAPLRARSSETYLLAIPDSESSKIRAIVPWCNRPTSEKNDADGVSPIVDRADLVGADEHQVGPSRSASRRNRHRRNRAVLEHDQRDHDDEPDRARIATPRVARLTVSGRGQAG